MVTSTQKRTAQATSSTSSKPGSVLGDYSRVTLIAGDTGHLTFGRSQTTLGSGNLSSMLQRYCFNGGCRLGPCLAPFGQTSARRVREFQAASGLPVTGIADAGVIAKLIG